MTYSNDVHDFPQIIPSIRRLVLQMNHELHPNCTQSPEDIHMAKRR
jgi:hypothetical protein